MFGKTQFRMPSRFLLEAGFSEQLSTRAAYNVTNNASFVSKFKEEITYEPLERVDNGPYQIGTIVSHQVFGNGKIIEKSGSGDNLKLVVLFSNGQWKKLLAKFANLTVVE